MNCFVLLSENGFSCTDILIVRSAFALFCLLSFVMACDGLCKSVFRFVPELKLVTNFTFVVFSVRLIGHASSARGVILLYLCKLRHCSLEINLFSRTCHIQICFNFYSNFLYT